MTILADFESRSRCDLKTHGGRLYWEHPSSEVLCAVLHDTETGETGVWTPGDPPPYTEADDVAYHNGTGFDRFAARRVGWPEPRTLIDTSEAARRAGLPGKLDALGTRWLGRAKDKAGSAFTKGLSTCRRPSGKGPDAIPPATWKAFTKAEKARRGVQKALTPEVLARVVDYCASDVEIMAEGWPRLLPFMTEGVFGGWEADVSAVDRIVNDRGVAFDSELARALLRCDERNQARVIEREAKAFGVTPAELRAVVSSHEQFAEVTGLPNAQAATIEETLALAGARLADPDMAHVHAEARRVAALCRARQALASIASGKLRAGLARVGADGRMRDNHRYYGAHTGRWSGQGMQLQNLTRPDKRFEGWTDDDVCRLADRALAGEDLDEGEIVIGLRACITASPGRRLAVCDFSGVEARAIAWCAGDRAALEVFASGRDVYKTAAAPMFGVSYDDVTKVQRNAGKMAELACGYQGGEGALLKIAGQNRFSFESVGIDPRDVVAAFRKQHPALVRFWHALGDAFVDAVRGEAGRVDRFDFVPSSDGRDVAIFLPSGRPIVYNDVGLAKDDRGRPAPYYLGTKGREHVYGGKIAENVIQAMCRDLMADALVRCEEAGLCPVLHVHDEVANDAERGALEATHEIMMTLPEWAEGFPVGAAGHEGRRYRK